MNHAQMNASIDALVELSKLSLEIYKKLDEEEPGAFGFTQRGLLMVAQTPHNLSSVIQEMQLVELAASKAAKWTHPRSRSSSPRFGQTVSSVAFIFPMRPTSNLLPLFAIFSPKPSPRARKCAWNRGPRFLHPKRFGSIRPHHARRNQSRQNCAGGGLMVRAFIGKAGAESADPVRKRLCRHRSTAAPHAPDSHYACRQKGGDHTAPRLDENRRHVGTGRSGRDGKSCPCENSSGWR